MQVLSYSILPSLAWPGHTLCGYSNRSQCRTSAHIGSADASRRERTSLTAYNCPCNERRISKVKRRITCAAADDDEVSEGAGKVLPSRLGTTIKRKLRSIQATLEALSPGELEDRLHRMHPTAKRNQFMDLIAECTVQGRTTIVLEVARKSPAETSESLTARCKKYIEWGANAIAVCTDEENTPQGLADLVAVSSGINAPVMRRDWIVHPIQIAETVEAGAGALHIVHSVLNKGTAALLNFGSACGLDVIVEVVNKMEADEMRNLGIPLYGVNLSVSLSLGIPGFKQDIARSLVRDLSFGAASIAGVSSIAEARVMQGAGVNAIFVTRETIQSASDEKARAFLQELNYAMSGDD
eukprot:jgi/Mesen1/7119/ME000369S06441